MIEFENATKIYEDDVTAVDNINLTIGDGELFVLIGPSGCGKTTAMTLINRLTELTSGDIRINGQSIKERDPVELRRSIGYVIQDVGLLPHMTIEQNVGLVPRIKGDDKEEYLKRADELLEMVDLEPATYGQRYPKELSGGQQQRIGVIRALAADPDILLMDEPFSALDPISREKLQEDFLKLNRQINKTIVFVTHDMDEALKIADKIALMKDGRVVQVDTPERILRYPKNEFVRSFIGEDRLELVHDTDSFPPLEPFISPAVTIREDRGLAQANKRLKERRVDSLIVVDYDNHFLGVATSRAIDEHYQKEELTIGEIITNDYASMNKSDSSEKALHLVKKTDRGYVVVVNEQNQVVGVVTTGSLVKLLVGQNIQNNQ